MPVRFRGLLTSSILAVLFLLLGTANLPAQAPGRKPTSQPVKFESVDGVELRGTYYPAAEGRKAPAMLLLAPPTPAGVPAAWEDLARGLQGHGFSTLVFDFRGHGRSTAVSRAFWNVPANVAGLRRRSTAGRETIHAGDFVPSYLPMLVNDITAARTFLDECNDSGTCNASNLIVVGGGEGATLGLLWLAAEAHRYAVGATAPESRGVTCAVWADLSSTLAGRRVPVRDWFRAAASEPKVPTAFLYPEGDEEAEHLADQLLRAARADTRLSGAVEVGRKDAVPTERIATYVKKVLERTVADPWTAIDFRDQVFVWSAPGRGPVVAKVRGEESLRLVPLEWLGVR